MRNAKLALLFVALLLLAGGSGSNARAAQAESNAKASPQTSASARTSAPAADRDAGQEQPWEMLPAGTVIQVRIADEVDSSKLHDGDLITGVVDPSVLVDSHAVIPRGTEAHMKVVEDKKAHVLGGKAKVELQLVAFVMNREKVGVDAGEYGREQGSLSYKVKSATRGAASSSTATGAASATPETGAVNPIVAVFSAAKVDLRAGRRIPFTLESDLSFQEPSVASAVTQ